jgi:hypothetical protein
VTRKGRDHGTSGVTEVDVTGFSDVAEAVDATV